MNTHEYPVGPPMHGNGTCEESILILLERERNMTRLESSGALASSLFLCASMSPQISRGLWWRWTRTIRPGPRGATPAAWACFSSTWLSSTATATASSTPGRLSKVGVVMVTTWSNHTHDNDITQLFWQVDLWRATAACRERKTTTHCAYLIRLFPDEKLAAGRRWLKKNLSGWFSWCGKKLIVRI